MHHNASRIQGSRRQSSGSLEKQVSSDSFFAWSPIRKLCKVRASLSLQPLQLPSASRWPPSLPQSIGKPSKMNFGYSAKRRDCDLARRYRAYPRIPPGDCWKTWAGRSASLARNVPSFVPRVRTEHSGVGARRYTSAKSLSKLTAICMKDEQGVTSIFIAPTWWKGHTICPYQRACYKSSRSQIQL